MFRSARNMTSCQGRLRVNRAIAGQSIVMHVHGSITNLLLRDHIILNRCSRDASGRTHVIVKCSDVPVGRLHGQRGVLNKLKKDVFSSVRQRLPQALVAIFNATAAALERAPWISAMNQFRPASTYKGFRVLYDISAPSSNTERNVGVFG
ncbi:hypothetical protein BC628DRAFT_634976 [Trametes gibbosa]|nr:hypothetical protein BC628DRAFT_634976 [Trametes gibbosa]